MGQRGAGWQVGGGRGHQSLGWALGAGSLRLELQPLPCAPPAPTVGSRLVLSLKVQRSSCDAGPWQVFGV